MFSAKFQYICLVWMIPDEAEAYIIRNVMRRTTIMIVLNQIAKSVIIARLYYFDMNYSKICFSYRFEHRLLPLWRDWKILSATKYAYAPNSEFQLRFFFKSLVHIFDASRWNNAWEGYSSYTLVVSLLIKWCLNQKTTLNNSTIFFMLSNQPINQIHV